MLLAPPRVIIRSLRLLYHRVQFVAPFFSRYTLMTSHMLWYLMMFISMLMIPWCFIVIQIFLCWKWQKFHDDIDSIVHWMVSKGSTCLRPRSAYRSSTNGCYYIVGNRLRCVTVAKHRYLGFYMFILIKAFNSTLTI